MLKNKFLVVFLVIFILFTCLFATSSNATFEFYNNGNSYSFPDLPDNLFEHYFIFTNNGNSFTLVSSDTCFLYKKYSFSELKGACSYYILNGAWSLNFYYTEEQCKTKTSSIDLTMYSPTVNDGFYFLFSSDDIYDTDGNLVFRPPVLFKVVVGLEKVEELPSLVEKLMRLMIPVGLIVFSAVLLVYLIQSKRWLHF